MEGSLDQRALGWCATVVGNSGDRRGRAAAVPRHGARGEAWLMTT
jgi:hypothetical protein